MPAHRNTRQFYREAAEYIDDLETRVLAEMEAEFRARGGRPRQDPAPTERPAPHFDPLGPSKGDRDRRDQEMDRISVSRGVSRWG